MVKYLNIGRLQFTFVFRHRYEKSERESGLSDIMWWNWELGLFFKRYKIVGSKNFHKPNEWKNNLVYSYMFGINLLICKAWFTVNRGGMTLEVDDLGV